VTPRFLTASKDPMAEEQINNPLHGMTLEMIVVSLQDFYGWEGLGERVKIRCFTQDPSVKSSLKFLRRTPWARKEVEDLFVYTLANYGDSD
jgi:uncharacterized protein (DUF2132 family)